MPESSRLSLENRRSPAKTSTRFCAEEPRQGREIRAIAGQKGAWEWLWGGTEAEAITSLRMKGHEYRSTSGLPGTLALLEAGFRITSLIDGGIPDLYDATQLIHPWPCVSP